MEEQRPSYTEIYPVVPLAYEDEVGIGIAHNPCPTPEGTHGTCYSNCVSNFEFQFNSFGRRGRPLFVKHPLHRVRERSSFPFTMKTHQQAPSGVIHTRSSVQPQATHTPSFFLAIAPPGVHYFYQNLNYPCRRADIEGLLFRTIGSTPRSLR
jgi:hypothetical protein